MRLTASGQVATETLRVWVGLLFLLFCTTFGFGAAVPVFDIDASAVSITHDAGSPEPGGSPSTYTNSGAFFGGASPALTAPYSPNAISFYAGGFTDANAGIGQTSSATQAKVLFPSGMGCTQTDPKGTQGSSAMSFSFIAAWDIPVQNSFGPPITTSFSIPVGAHVSAGGSAEFTCNIHWDMVINGVMYNNVRTAYTATQNYGPGTYLSNFTAPAAAVTPGSFNSIDNGNTFQLIETGNVSFYANNESGPSFAEIPTFDDLTNSMNSTGKTITYTDPTTMTTDQINENQFDQQYGYTPGADFSFSSVPYSGDQTGVNAIPLPSSFWAGAVLMCGLGLAKFFKSPVAAFHVRSV